MGSIGPDGLFVPSGAVHLTMSDGVAVLTLDNPPVNAIDRGVVVDLDRHLDTIEADATVRVVVLTGAGGRIFSAGSDILEISTLLEPGSAVRHKLQPQLRVFGRLADLPLITIAALNGPALGGGLEVAVCCDFVIAEEHAEVGSPEILLGLFPSSGGTFRVAGRIGPARAREMQLSGQPISPETAAAWGLVSRVVPRGTGLAHALDLAVMLRERSPVSVSAVKELVTAVDDVERRSTEWSEQAFTSEVATRQVAAFLTQGRSQA